MSFIYERHFWCSGCRRNHVLKLYSQREIDDQERAGLFADGDYADQPRRHAVCVHCDRSITPHTDIDMVAVHGEWKEICLDCFRRS